MASHTRYVDRNIPRNSMHDFEDRIDEITEQLIHAAENVGFFTLVNHGLSKQSRRIYVCDIKEVLRFTRQSQSNCTMELGQRGLGKELTSSTLYWTI